MAGRDGMGSFKASLWNSNLKQQLRLSNRSTVRFELARAFLFVALALGASAAQATPASATASAAADERIDRALAGYEAKLASKSALELTAETGINFGLTMAHCSRAIVLGVVDAVGESTDSAALAQHLGQVEADAPCRITSIRLGLSGALMKRRSAAAWSTFSKSARETIANQVDVVSERLRN